MPMSRVAPSRLALVVGALSGPAVVVLVVLAVAGELRPGVALAAIFVIAASLLFLVHQHFARLDALRSRVSALTREHGSAHTVDDRGGSLSVAELEAAIGELDRGWERRGEEA